MAKFTLTLTSAGTALLGKALAAKSLVFTSFGLGDGVYSGSAVSKTALTAEQVKVDITKITRSGSIATLRATVVYADLPSEFKWRELGVYAKDPDTGADTLYAYANAGDNYDTIGGDQALTEMNVSVKVAVAESSDVNVTIQSGETVYVSASDFDKLSETVDKGAVITLAHSKSGSTHIFTGLGSKTGLVPAQFKSTAAYTEGDGATIDGVSYTIQLTGADDPETDLFVSGKSILVDIDTDGKTINFKAGGGLTKAKLSLATATEDKVFNGYTFYSGDKSLKTGKALNTVTTVDASNLFNGKKAYTNNGVLITGSALSTTTTVNASNLFSGKKAYTNTGKLITGTALSVTTDVAASNLFSGKKAYTNSGTLITGTALSETTTASAAYIASGKTAYDNNGNLITGTLEASKVYIDTRSVSVTFTYDESKGYYVGNTAVAVPYPNAKYIIAVVKTTGSTSSFSVNGEGTVSRTNGVWAGSGDTGMVYIRGDGNYLNYGNAGAVYESNLKTCTGTITFYSVVEVS